MRRRIPRGFANEPAAIESANEVNGEEEKEMLRKGVQVQVKVSGPCDFEVRNLGPLVPQRCEYLDSLRSTSNFSHT